MNKILKIVWMLGVVIATSCFGSPLIGVEDWNGALNDLAGWQYVVNQGASTPALANSGGASGALQLTFASDGNPYSPIVSVQSGGSTKFKGNYYNYVNTELTPLGYRLGVEFWLKTDENYNPADGSMWLYFVADNGNTWTSSKPLTQPSPLQGYTRFSFEIGDLANWAPSQSSTFSDDFAHVARFGLGFIGAQVGNNIVYLDDFEIKVLVPEPETVWMMVMVLASLGLTFRGRLTELGNQVKARLVA